jgi:hypothetical protein
MICRCRPGGEPGINSTGRLGNRPAEPIRITQSFAVLSNLPSVRSLRSDTIPEIQRSGRLSAVSGFATLGRTLGSLCHPLRFCVTGRKSIWISELSSTVFEEIFNFFLQPPFRVLHPQRTEWAVLRKKPDGSTGFFQAAPRPAARAGSGFLSYHSTPHRMALNKGPDLLAIFFRGFPPARRALRTRLILSGAGRLQAALPAGYSRHCPLPGR